MVLPSAKSRDSPHIAPHEWNTCGHGAVKQVANHGQFLALMNVYTTAKALIRELKHRLRIWSHAVLLISTAYSGSLSFYTARIPENPWSSPFRRHQLSGTFNSSTGEGNPTATTSSSSIVRHNSWHAVKTAWMSELLLWCEWAVRKHVQCLKNAKYVKSEKYDIYAIVLVMPMKPRHEHWDLEPTATGWCSFRLPSCFPQWVTPWFLGPSTSSPRPCRGTPLPSLKVEALSVSGALVALDTIPFKKKKNISTSDCLV